MFRELAAEMLGTAMLLIGVVGSGIMGAALSDGSIALALLANAIATGCMLYVIITTLGPISGAHFNPVVTLYFWWTGSIETPAAAAYIPAQIIGGILGVWLTHAMFDLPLLQLSTTERATTGLWISEIAATFGLLFVIIGGLRAQPQTVPALVGLYITGAYWFTSSTSFANPAVTIARSLSDSFAGILPAHMPMFIAMQVLGLGVSVAILPWLFREANP